MATKRSQPPTLHPRHLTPWLVKQRDLQRYLGRALTACKKGRVIFFFHTLENEKRLFSLVRLEDHSTLLSAARTDFVRGRFREVSLEKQSR